MLADTQTPAPTAMNTPAKLMTFGLIGIALYIAFFREPPKRRP